jgi:hypothetical protein
MPTRRFSDTHGLDWEVWDVLPPTITQSAAVAAPSLEMQVPAALARGWLCFQAGTDRRRFAPIPHAWDELPDGVLRLMLDFSDRVHSDIDHRVAD